MLRFAWILIISSAAFAADNPLFQLMQGHWIGTGTRQYMTDGSRAIITAEVQSTLEQLNGRSALISQNKITESREGSPQEPSRTYLSNYWIRETQTPGIFSLGYSGSDQGTSAGVMGPDGVFRVQQTLTSGPNQVEVDSETHFGVEEAFYSEWVFLGGKQTSRTDIEYRRAAPQ